jgi:prepilin peptidase CpaA
MLPAFQTLLLFLFPTLVIVAALRDATSMTIPNWISLALVGAYPIAALALGLPLGVVGVSAALGVGALALGVAMFALRWIGGGDAKLFAASTLWLGLSGAAPFLLWTALAGGVLAAALLGARRMVALSGFPVRQAWIGRLLAPEGDIPYGIAIAAGALAAFPEAALMQAFRV